MKNQSGSAKLNCLYLLICVFGGIGAILISLYFRSLFLLILSFLFLIGGAFFYGIQWVLSRKIEQKMSAEARKQQEPIEREKMLPLLACLVFCLCLCFFVYRLLEGARIAELLFEVLQLN